MVVGVLSDVVAGQLITAMDGLKNVLRDSISFSDSAQKASLALGQTYSQTRDTLAPAMENLRGDLNEKFAAAIAGMEAGLQGNTAGIARLINQQRLTGTQSANTAKALAGLEAGLDLSRDQTNNLAESLIQTGNEFQVSTDELVKAVDALKATFPAQALAGMGDKVMGAVASLQAELGPQLAGPLNNVMKMVLDTSFEGQERLTRLNIGGVREQLSAAKDAAQAQEILSNAFRTASESFESIAGNAETNFISLAAANEVFGEQSINFTTIAAAFGDRVRTEGQEAVNFGDTLANIRKEVFVPLQEAFSQFYPALLAVAKIVGGLVKNVFDQLVIVGKQFYVGLGGLSGIIEKAKTIFDAFKEKVGSVANFVKNTLGVVFVALAVKIGLVIAPFVPLIAVVTAVGFILKKLNDHFGFMDPLIAGVNFAFAKLKEGIGTMLIALGEIHGIPDALIDWGNALKETQVTADKQGPQPLTGVDLDNAFDALIKSDVAFAEKSLAVSEEIKLNTKVVADDIASKRAGDSNPFLDETTLTLGRTIQDIIGIGSDETAQEILETLKEANMQRDAASMTGGSPSLTNEQDS